MDPGIITNEYYLENYDVDKINLNKYKICEICNVIIDLDKGVEHCNNCNICIIGNDHHCLWTSKCVGRKNLYMFRAFVVFLTFHIAFIFINTIILSIFINQIHKNKHKK